jgi:hypothetical protein
MLRSAFYGGPAFLTHDSQTWQLGDENFEVSNELKQIEVKSNIQGKLGDREDYGISVIKATPLALRSVLATQFGKLFAFQPSNMGALLFPSTDLPGVLQTKDGKSITFSACALSQPPTLQFAATKPLIASQVEWTCLRKDNTAATATNAHVVVASSAYTQPTLDPTNIVDSTFTAAWGSTSPFTAIECDPEGIKLEVKYDWEQLMTWNDGMIQMRLKNVTAQVRFVPINVDAADFHDTLLLLDGASAGRGKFLSGRGQAFTVTGAATGDPVLTIANAVPTQGALRFGAPSRVGEVVLQAQRVYSGGALQALFALSVVA